MVQARDFMEMGLAFHGHKCPAMPLGLRAAAGAMNRLSVDHAQDKELHVISDYVLDRKKGVFEAKPCARCGELTFVDKLVDDGDGLVCLVCHESAASAG